jgi:hypothetical protein
MITTEIKDIKNNIKGDIIKIENKLDNNSIDIAPLVLVNPV